MNDSYEVLTKCCYFVANLSSKMAATYSKAKSKRLENWEGFRSQLLEVYVSHEELCNSICNFCGVESIDLYRCLDCALWITTCQSCMTKSHSFPHLHTIEKWMHGTFIECPLNSKVWKRTDHACESNYQKELVIVDDKDRQHLRHVQFCSCEQEPITLLRFNLWPASPKHPRLAFHVQLLMLLNGLLLESHVLVKSFCAVLTARHSKHNAFYATKERQDLYKILMKETIQEFRHLLYKKEHPKHLCEKLDDGTECPACYNVTQPIVSFDADFQLVRKGSSGNNWKPPNHEGHFFVNQDSVDNFMSEYTTDNKKEDVECNEFQAGNQLRSKIKNKKLSETAVFGSICRHECPQLFCSLKHGER
ncbi:uncharacterized protein [Mytilus edulis]|uniref:uncharacterized protein n=1 Tax=Mytilus edulis TaxID=6550 RepID=UPI0039EF8864